MKRGDIVLAAERGPYTGKPRPWVIVQRDAFLVEPASLTMVPIVDAKHEAHFRIPIEPRDTNGLHKSSTIAVDKIATVKRKAVGEPVGEVSARQLLEIDEALRLWLDL